MATCFSFSKEVARSAVHQRNIFRHFLPQLPAVCSWLKRMTQPGGASRRKRATQLPIACHPWCICKVAGAHAVGGSCDGASGGHKWDITVRVVCRVLHVTQSLRSGSCSCFQVWSCGTLQSRCIANCDATNSAHARPRVGMQPAAVCLPHTGTDNRVRAEHDASVQLSD